VLAPEGASEYIEASPPCNLGAGRRVVVARQQNHTDVAAHLPEGRDHLAPIRVIIEIEHDRNRGFPNYLIYLRPSSVDDHPPRAIKNGLQTIPVVRIAVCQNDSRF
jgi:hypothetical protein